ncbi:MAG: class I SAM-dependent methyltransferase [Sphingomonas sp.]|uniref:class I SAM-dependent methyltransferase n=1 Tax=Sphingomonas sp. TaxID=28214 RepID=UPI00180233FC|nr:class I SAM-dependent methyltransferase [Sphingomonas sp.]MBA3668399.1 class I SAM-dependent methyltransferase [Sphingomonas sp.]
MLSTDKAWKKWGSQDPYFGVLAQDRFSAALIGENRDEFFASGRHSIAHLLTEYERHLGPLPRGRALDHGCGVGRLSLPLAAEFAEVLALDVAPAMLAEAAANARQAGATNLRFAEADDGLSRADGAFDFVNSLMVLQHVPVRRGLRILDALVDKVAPGGGFHLHLSIRTDRGGWRWLYWASANIPGVKIWQNICAGRPWNAPAMQMNHYPLSPIVSRLAMRGIVQLIVISEPHARFVTCSLIGRKPA